MYVLQIAPQDNTNISNFLQNASDEVPSTNKLTFISLVKPMAVRNLSFWSWIMTLNYDSELQAAKLPMAHGRDAIEVADGAAEDGGSVLPGKEPVEVGLDGLTVGN